MEASQWATSKLHVWGLSLCHYLEQEPDMINGMSSTQRVLIGAATVVAVIGIGVGVNAAVNDPVSVADEAVAVEAAAAVPIPAQEVTSVAAPASAEGITDAEAAGLLFMREEEKLARDVYLTFADMWGSRIFSNIQGAEQMHMDSMLGLIETYGLTDPVGDNEIGVFVDPELQQMYDELVAAGSVSVEAALEVGGLIEEVDIEDLAIYIEATNAADIITAYEHLLSGSENHLRAFVSQLDKAGVEYQPTVLDAKLYESIVSAENERGGGGGQGGGRHGQRGHGGPNA